MGRLKRRCRGVDLAGLRAGALRPCARADQPVCSGRSTETRGASRQAILPGGKEDNPGPLAERYSLRAFLGSLQSAATGCRPGERVEGDSCRAFAGRPRSSDLRRSSRACHARGEDTSYPLLESSLQGCVRAHAAGAELRHRQRRSDLRMHSTASYSALFPHAAPGDYRAFVEKTVGYVIERIERRASRHAGLCGAGKQRLRLRRLPA
jgi:hypothetical protein